MHGPSHVLLITCLLPSACVEKVVDLRDPAPPAVVCDEGERENPATSRCEPCTVREPRPDEVCSCGHADNPRPFPYCDSVDADYDCLPCSGSVESCRVYGTVDPSADDCQRLRDCCDELASAPDSVPCCPVEQTVFCEIASGSNALVFSCVSGS